MEVRKATVTLVGTVSSLGIFLLNPFSSLIVIRTLGVVLVSISVLQSFLPKDQS
jgi:hypothetical protein